jgi:ribose transport system permease protein
MKKILGISTLLVIVVVLTSLKAPNFLSAYNIQNTARWTALFSMISIGAAFVIITGGIDLSIGSVVGLVGCLLPTLLDRGWPVPAAIGAVLAMSALIGLVHGLLITKLKLQPFIVTLCGMLIFRSLPRWFTLDDTQGFKNFPDLQQLAKGNIASVPTPFVFMMVLAVLAAIFLNKTIYGRYLLAIGRNEEAARYSGINTDRMKILAYIMCSMMTGIGGIFFALYLDSIQPSAHGNFYEVYAIAAAVLGGCSLRGGEGSIAGVVIGAALMRVLYNAINIVGLPTQLEFGIIGLVILGGVISDEVIRRLAARRRSDPIAAEPAVLQPEKHAEVSAHK